ncbi:unnamed protein product, partial [Polarella glacialis]
MDAERGVAVYPARAMGGEAAAVLAIACHRSQDLAVSGHVDRCARVFSPLTGRQICELSGHGDVVTAVALDPFGTGFEIATGCHDGILRLFDIRTSRCFQEVTLHERMHDEAIHS